MTSCVLFAQKRESSDNVAVIVSHANIVKAGEDLTFDVKLDRGASIDGALQYFLVGPGDLQISTSATVPANTTTVHVSIRIPDTADDGVWHIEIFGFFAGTKTIPLKASSVAFRVIARTDIVLPSSAEISITPSQVQLFRTEVLALQTQIQSLKANIATYQQGKDSSSVPRILERNVNGALASLDKTEAEFLKLAPGSTQRDNAAVFFDDIAFSYRDALREIEKSKKVQNHTNVITWASFPQTKQAEYTTVAAYTLRAFEQNELSYSRVADAGSLVFDLVANSNPPGAEIAYRRRGDSYHVNPNPTNTTIKTLTFAIWTVRFRKPGYRDKETEHDPSRDPNHVIYVELEKDRGR
jgi:hypothetical protein